MFKVLLVDDEPIIKKGLKNIIQWEQLGCEICGEASDGFEGQELIKALMPNIIITDICMPGIDGLKMIQNIKEIVPESKIIILTGYRDFDYLQEALKLGVFDYMLKPTRLENLTEVVKRAVNELKQQNDKNESINKFINLFKQNIPVLKEKLLYDIMNEININENDIFSRMETLKLKVSKFSLLVVENESEENNNDQVHQKKHLYQLGIVNTFKDVFAEKFNILNVSLTSKWIAFILQPLDLNENVDEIVSNKCIHMQDIIQNCFDFTITVAISSSGNNILELPQKYLECQEALRHKFYVGSNSVIFYKDLSAFFKYQDHPLLEKYFKSLLEGIKAGNVGTVKSYLHDIGNYVNAHSSGFNTAYAKNFYRSTILSINDIRMSIPSKDSEISKSEKEFESMVALLDKCKDVKELNGYLEDMSLSTAYKVNSLNNKSMKLLLSKAVEYLKNNYNEQITLNDVAEHTYVSACYISRMFKKELGKNFVDYLNEIRMEKAKDLLKEIKYKTYEVAEMVGIPDAHYFSKIFKKYVGITPKEYRGSTYDN